MTLDSRAHRGVRHRPPSLSSTRPLWGSVLLLAALPGCASLLGFRSYQQDVQRLAREQFPCSDVTVVDNRDHYVAVGCGLVAFYQCAATDTFQSACFRMPQAPSQP